MNNAEHAKPEKHVTMHTHTAQPADPWSQCNEHILFVGTPKQKVGPNNIKHERDRDLYSYMYMRTNPQVDAQ